MQFQIKRVYERPAPTDGVRVLVDRLWPRGLTKRDAAVDVWAKELAPSDDLRRWFTHKDERFEEFTRRYRRELASATEEQTRCVSPSAVGMESKSAWSATRWSRPGRAGSCVA